MKRKYNFSHTISCGRGNHFPNFIKHTPQYMVFAIQEQEKTIKFHLITTICNTNSIISKNITGYPHAIELRIIA